MLTVFSANTAAAAFYAKMKYGVDQGSPSECGVDGAPYEILIKVVDAAAAATARARAALLGDSEEEEE